MSYIIITCHGHKYAITHNRDLPCSIYIKTNTHYWSSYKWWKPWQRCSRSCSIVYNHLPSIETHCIVTTLYFTVCISICIIIICILLSPRLSGIVTHIRIRSERRRWRWTWWWWWRKWFIKITVVITWLKNKNEKVTLTQTNYFEYAPCAFIDKENTKQNLNWSFSMERIKYVAV